ncbi:MAG: PRTRC system ThiF family protein [Pedobacter sp.]|nr:MAG: PRTRC system ThiF family protein [Pedobacter sp.]
MKAQKKRVHLVHPYLLNPTNPIKVSLIGAGGTGSSMLTNLARINHSLIALGHCGLQVTVFDPDNVEVPNLGRQLFTQGELGLNKAVALIGRINRFFGTDWKAVSERFEVKGDKGIGQRQANVTISCVDSVGARIAIADILKILDRESHSRDGAWYWMDFGNGKHTGQVLLSTIGAVKQSKSKKFRPVGNLPFVTEEYRVLLDNQSEEDMPSCSLAQALDKQDLFINSGLATMGASLLWSMLRMGILEYRGLFLNLADFRSTPVPI